MLTALRLGDSSVGRMSGG